MAHRLLVDSDVILDLFLDREPHHSVALQFFSYLERNTDTVVAHASPVAIANVAYILAKVRSQAYDVAKLAQLRKILRVVLVDERVIEKAITNPHVGLEDSIQYHSAVEAGLRVIVTRNVDEAIVGSISILTPEESLAMDLTEKST